VRGISGVQLTHGLGRSVVSLPTGFTVWSENPGAFRWQGTCGRYLYRPFIDLVDVAETSIQRHEEIVAARTAGRPHP
jgi:hypothetical protein